MPARRTLGKNLSALLSQPSVVAVKKDPSKSATTVQDQVKEVARESDIDSQLQQLPIEYIVPGKFQPRRHFDKAALEELAHSIQEQGIIQPLVVRKVADKKYELVAGERRWRAAQMAKLEQVPVVINNIDDQTAMALGLIENIQRENLNPIEEATALQRLLEEFQLTHQEIAKAVGKSRTTITNMLRLMSLSPAVRKMLEQGAIEMGHARAMLSLEPEQQLVCAKKVSQGRLSVRETEKLVKQMLMPVAAKTDLISKDPNIKNLEEELAQRLSAPVILKHQAKGKGKLVIDYYDLEHLQSILDRIS